MVRKKFSNSWIEKVIETFDEMSRDEDSNAYKKFMEYVRILNSFETDDLDSFPAPDNYNAEFIESKFEDLLSKETKQRLLDRW